MTTARLVPALLILLAGAAGAAPDAEWSWGGDLRVRGYHLENMWDANSDADGDRWGVLRQRLRLHAAGTLARGVQTYVRVANQHFGEGVTYPDGWEADNKSDKIFVDQAWAELPGLLGLPLALKAGRQDVRYGGGWVLFDGQSQTASTSAYLDGVRARWDLGGRGTADLLWFKDQENRRDDDARDDVTLSGLYLDLARGPHARELYVLRREDQNLDRDVILVGARAGGGLGRLAWTLEGGLQRGDADASRAQEAWGFSGEVRCALSAGAGSPAVFVLYDALSGDDPATAGVGERWDVFHGGWPRRGDLLAWTYLNLGPGNVLSAVDPVYADGSSQTGEVVYGNLLMPTVGLEGRPQRDLLLKASWSGLRAHRTPAASRDLGDLVQLTARYRWSPEVTLAAYAARLWPGAAYGADPDPVDELFWEIDLTF